MKWIITLMLPLAVSFSHIYAQKQDNIWVLGYNYEPTTPESEGYLFNFEDSLKVVYSTRNMPIVLTNASICDSTGNLLMYSNGCYIEKANGTVIENSEGLNPGLLYNLSCADSSGYRLENSMILIEGTGDTPLFHFFHIPSVAPFFLKDVLHTEVDMSANNGNGITVVKNEVIVSDTIHRHGLHALRHANGRDWWVIAAKKFSNRYYFILLTPHGIETKYQEIGDVDTGEVAGGEIVFSPDGSKLARFDSQDDLKVFDFDRCTGALSNPVHVKMQNEADIEILAGLAWSADGRYLYASENRRLLQFDTYAADLAGSMQVVATAEPPVCFLSGSIGTMELGPDGMIYCRPYNGQKCLHRMKHPERAGAACAFEQNYFQLEYPFNGLPHFPNFRLGPVDGSPCDTLGLDNHPLANWRYDRTPGLGVDFTSVSWYNPTDWLWDFGDPASGAANSSTEKHPAHTYPAPGPYEVCLTVSNQYGSDTKCKTVWVGTTSSLAPTPSDGEGVILWPNPTTGMVYWSGVPEGEPVTVRVVDALGRLRLERHTTEHQADLSALEDGLYFTVLVGRDGQVWASKTVVLAKGY
jgi:hypothetical protein